MKYYQEVIIKNVTFGKIVSSFNNIKIVNFLTQLQPIQIIKWDGIEDGKVAHFKLWFFGWKDFEVIHSDYYLDENELSFIDNGSVLPLGLTFWRHKHSIVIKKGYVTIIDNLKFNHESSFLGYLLYPLLVSPIFLRKLLYRLYFRGL
tara:strand:+ start:1192 stop:1632 length:441 start_codon:yes stop_codon:yes gene_type:complete